MKYKFNQKEGIYDFVFKIQGNDVFILLTNIGNLASFFLFIICSMAQNRSIL